MGSVDFTPWLFLAEHLLFVAALTATAWVLGRIVTRRSAFADGLEGFALSTALGLGLLSWGLFVLGLAGLFYRVTIVAVVVAIHVTGLREWRELWDELGSPRGRGEHRWVLWLFLVALLPAILLPLYPPTLSDSTAYHLPLAEAFLDGHRPTFDETLRFPVFPLLDETLFAVAMGFVGDTAAQLVHHLQMWLTALLAVAWGRRLGSPWGGRWAAALWLGTPLVVWIGGAAYVDLSLALFVTAALFCWRFREDSDLRSVAIVGGLAGFAAGTKYLGLLCVAGLGLLTFIETIRRRQIATVLVFTVATVLALTPWYGWILAETGSPVFPFYPQIFGDSEWQTAIDRGRSATSELHGIVTGIDDLLRVPWDALFQRQLYGHQAPLSPLLLLLLPIGGLCALHADTRWLLFWVAAYGLFWLTTVRDLRFLLAVLPILALSLMVGLDRLLSPKMGAPARARALSWGLTALLLAPGSVYALYKLGERGVWPPTDASARRHYLLEQLPEYAAIDHLNRLHGDSYTIYGLSRPRLNYHADGRFLGARLGPYEYRKVRSAFGDGRELHRRLASFGADYLLFVETRTSGTLPEDPAFAELFELALEGDGFALYQLREVRP